MNAIRRLTVLAALLAAAGCLPSTGNTLDWRDQSLAKGFEGAMREADREGLAFATTVDHGGFAGEPALAEFPIRVGEFPQRATVALRCLPGFDARIRFQGFEAKKLAVQARNIRLTDSRGHEFRVMPLVPGLASAAEFRVDPVQNARYFEFNNREYTLALEINFTYDRQPLRASWPKIHCAIERTIDSR